MIQQYRDRLMLPERRVLTIVRFSAKAIAPTMPVDPAQVQQQFDAKKASYGKPETRSLVEIPLNNPSDANAVGAALAKGEDPNAIAKSIGVTPIVYTDQAQSAIADVKAGQAAFAMKEGAVSGPVQGDFKTVILKVTKVTPGQAPDINAVRAEIMAQLQEAAAEDKIYNESQAFEDAVQGGANMQAAAGKVGATAITVGPVTAEGKDPSNPEPNPLLTPKLLKSAFSQAPGTPSDIQSGADKGELFVVQVDKVIPPNPPGLDEKGVRELLTNAYYQQAIVTFLQGRAANAQAALQKGQSFETVASSMGAQVAHQVGIERIQAKQLEGTVGQDFLAQLFNAKPGAIFSAGSDPLRGFVVARLDAIHPADPKEVAKYLDQLRQQGGQSYLESLATSLKTLAMQDVKPSTDLDLARKAMGIDQAMVDRNAPKLLPGQGKTPAQGAAKSLAR
jgi:peptidyl-prolyl cis-trans isomerase D